MVKKYFSLASIVRLINDRKDNRYVLITLIKVYGDNKRKFKSDNRRVEAESFLRSGEIKKVLSDVYQIGLSITQIKRALKYLIYKDAVIRQFLYTSRTTDCYRVSTPLYIKIKKARIKIPIPSKGISSNS